MIILETIGLIVAVLFAMAVLTTLLVLIVGNGNIGFDTEHDLTLYLITLILVVVVVTIGLSASFMSFYNCPEEWGYTRIEEETENVRNTDCSDNESDR